MSVLGRLIRLPGELLGWGLIGLIRAYQRLISPMIGPHCRFQPTCSEYLILAVRKYGLLYGISKGIGRILRCHPWNSGGDDLP